MSSNRNQKVGEVSQRTRVRPPRTEEEEEVEVKPTRSKTTTVKTEAKNPPKTEVKKVVERKPAEEPKPKVEAPPAEEETKKKKVPTPEELRKKFLEEFPKLVKTSQQRSSFLKAWNPKNPLTMGGMAKRLKDNQDKKGNDEIVYSLEMAITGSRGDFDELMKEAVVKEWMKASELTRDDIVSNFITFDNYEDRKDSDEIKTLRDTNTRLLNELNHRQELFNNHFNKTKNTTAQTRQEKIIASFESYTESNRVYDVCNWNSNTKHGYKSSARPPANSKRLVMKSYPICSSDEERMRDFLKYLDIDPDLASEAFSGEK